MPVSLTGLDLSFLKDPANRLPPRPPRKRTNFKRARSDLPCPTFMADITPFVNVATRDGGEITSRSQLREFEKRSGMRQVGNDFEPGSIAKEREAQKAEWQRLASTVDHGWTDFTD